MDPLIINKGDMISVGASTTIPITAGLKDDPEIIKSEINSVYYFNMAPGHLRADSLSTLNLNDSSLKEMVFALYVTVNSFDSQMQGKLLVSYTMHVLFHLLNSLVFVFIFANIVPVDFKIFNS